MDAEFDARLAVGGVAFDRRDATLLRAIAREGSLNAAAEALGRSYSRAHGRISALETEVGPLVDRQRGGRGGGGSRLTDTAHDLLARYARLVAALEGTAVTEKVEVVGKVQRRDGRLAAVDTAAGTLTAVLAEPADRVRVTFRADAVTLHDPAGVPHADATSARNRLEGTVTDVDEATATATVRVDVGADEPLAVEVTTESLDRLDLAVGDTVVAAFKATATRATPVLEDAG